MMNNMTKQKYTNHTDLEKNLIRVIRELARELHGERAEKISVSLNSRLDRDLGLDSLARMELLTRLEKQFSVTLSEQLLATAETPQELFEQLKHSKTTPSRKEDVQQAPPASQEAVTDIPHQATTLNEVLHFHAASHPDSVHLLFEYCEESISSLSYRDLLAGAEKLAGGLQHHGLQPGNSVAIMLPTGADYFFCFFGILLAGGIPVPLYPPVRPSQIEEHMRRHRKILDNSQARFLITIPKVKQVARLLGAQVSCLDAVLETKELHNHADIFEPVQVQPTDIAFLQYTSGSTGDPKGVVLTHANLLANIQAMGKTTEVTPDDVFVSWLPLYHDMGLIGAWLGSLFFGCRLVIMPPLAFIARPKRWLLTIHKHKGTLSASPNFGYELCCKRIDDKSLEGLSLHSWRLAFNGAEPVSPQTLINFSKRFKPYGLSETSLAPVYGLAESSVGLAFPPIGRSFIIDQVNRDVFTLSGRAEPVHNNSDDVLKFVACGRPLPDHQIRIVDTSSRELPDRHQGRIQFKGPSTTSGYFRNPGQTQQLFDETWLDSGDLGYMSQGDLYVTGRKKDIIIRGGRNFYPHEIEEAVGDIDGIRKGCVVAFGSSDNRSATERLVILAETRARKEETMEKLRKHITERTVDITGLAPDDIVLCLPGSVLKTSSGKIRRSASKASYESRKIGKPARAVWLQVVRMSVQAIGPQISRMYRRTAESAYALYCWLLFGLISFITGVAVILIPTKKGRWLASRLAGKILAALSGSSIAVSGLDQLEKKQQYIIASNHMSYLDSFVLNTILPIQCCFVAKAELSRNRLLKLLLSRIDVTFVNRFDFRKGVDDAKGIDHLVKEGKTLLFFCEGTFGRMPGLLPFQMGAFLTSARNGVPIVPITINGTRDKLRGDTWFPRKGSIQVHISQPLRANDKSWAAAISLRDRVREKILVNLQEPDCADMYTSITKSEVAKATSQESER